MLPTNHPLLARLRGHVIPAMATPLTAEGYHVNTAVVPALVDFLLARGVGGLFVGGTTGEGVLLSLEERGALHAAAIAATRGRAPVLAHVGANDTRSAVQLARQAAQLGADAVVAVTPYFYPMSDETLLAYFEQTAGAAADLPFLVYDIPQMAVNAINPALLRRLGERIANFAGLKTSRTDMQAIRQLLDAAPDGALVLAGNEPIALGSLALGAHGLISGLATAIPEPFVALMRAFTAGRLDEARGWQRRINQMLALIPAGERIGGMKAILTARGVAVGPPVPPRGEVSAEIWPQLAPLLTL